METLGIGLFLLIIMLVLLSGGVWIAMTLAICGWVGQASALACQRAPRSTPISRRRHISAVTSTR